MNSSPHNSVRCRFSWQEARSWKASTQLSTRRGTWHFLALRDKSPHSNHHNSLRCHSSGRRCSWKASQLYTSSGARHFFALLDMSAELSLLSVSLRSASLMRGSFLEGLSAPHCVETPTTIFITINTLSNQIATIPLHISTLDEKLITLFWKQQSLLFLLRIASLIRGSFQRIAYFLFSEGQSALHSGEAHHISLRFTWVKHSRHYDLVPSSFSQREALVTTVYSSLFTSCTHYSGFSRGALLPSPHIRNKNTLSLH
jgi:hypothetical protein